MQLLPHVALINIITMGTVMGFDRNGPTAAHNPKILILIFILSNIKI